MLILCSSLLLANLVLASPLEANKVFSYEVRVIYRNEGEEAWVLSDGDVAFSLFMNNSWQDVELEETSRPVERVVRDYDGNLWALLYVPEEDRILEPGESIELYARYKFITRPREAPGILIEASGTLSDIPAELKDAYCGPAACWLTEDEELRSLAQELAYGKQNVLDIICSFVSWIHENIYYETYELPRYPNETYMGRRGDCDDQANLFITFCRIVGIPAYLQIGCIYYISPEAEETLWDGHVKLRVRNVAWHGWAVAYVPPWGWLPVDLTASPGIDEDPLNAIRKAIVWMQDVVLCYNITVSDYIAEAREYREELIEHDIYIYEEESMVFLGTEASFEQLVGLINAIGYYMLIAFIALSLGGVIAAAIYIWRSRRMKGEGVVYTAPYSLYHS